MAKKGQKNGTKKPLDHSVQDADGGSNDLDPGKPRQLSFYLSVAVLVLGIAIALYLKRRDVQVQLEKLDQHYQLNVKPQLEQLEQELLSRLNETIPLAYFTQQSNRPGYHLAKEGAKAKYPVVMIPGFVTSGLEVWGAKDCAKRHFRQRLWASIGMARGVLSERDCWKEHMMLDPYTGGDPENIRVRSASGFEAGDYFLANYWVWGKMIENLADVGYTPSEMTLEPYDWRLAYPLLEERDGYFTKLKLKIEAFRRTTGKKVVLSSHSMGALVVTYFFAWVTTSEVNGGGGGGKNWVHDNVHAFVNIAGSHLGVPKAVSALLSGDMRDTAMLGNLGGMVEQIFSRRLRVDLFCTWGSLWSMLPKGEETIWGVGADMCPHGRSADDPLCPVDELSPMLVMTDSLDESQKEVLLQNSSKPGLLGDFISKQRHYTKDSIDFLRSFAGGIGSEISGNKLHSFHGNEKPSSRTWHDPSRTPLPHAPNMKIYCMYGTGVETERAYYYKRNLDGGDPNLDTDIPLPVLLDGQVFDEERNVSYGVRFSDGDGTVPLVSLGYICVDAWQRKNSGLNPSNSEVITREYRNQYEFSLEDPGRGGPRSSDHVDILGNLDMLSDFLKVATGFRESEVNPKIESRIVEIANEINNHPLGGVRERNFWKDIFSSN